MVNLCSLYNEQGCTVYHSLKIFFFQKFIFGRILFAELWEINDFKVKVKTFQYPFDVQFLCFPLIHQKSLGM